MARLRTPSYVTQPCGSPIQESSLAPTPDVTAFSTQQRESSTNRSWSPRECGIWREGANVLGISSFAGLCTPRGPQAVGSPGMVVCSEKNRPPDLGEIVARMRTRFKRLTRRKNPREFVSRQVVASGQCCTALFVGGARQKPKTPGLPRVPILIRRLLVRAGPGCR